jgi:Holliday junction resolvase RusA-like endonuclease
VLDALTGELLRDDAQVVELYARKRFALGDPGVVIDVLAAPEPQP